MKTISTVLLSAILFFSCKKNDSPYDSNIKTPLQIEFDNVVGDQDLQLNTVNYTNSSGETFSVVSLRYFISNISLVKTDGSEYVVPQDSSYFLIDENMKETEVTVKVPEGEYKGLKFMVGVDSLRSTMDLSKRSGVLTPSIANYMNENNGYIFFSFIGRSPQADQDRFDFEIGGYGGKTSPTFNNIKMVSLDLTARGVAKVVSSDISDIHLMVDLLKVFNGTQTISLATNNIVEFEPFSVNVANNYAQMFSHDHTHN